ncbi:isoprenyl transferase [Propionispira raffinosivorans]|uniref:isoprenyl transferase n=1 Tax=Propionispira raffinosivorans TaxID=86959 RepID=UPI0003622110|nr:isoprenyl transferase [Propionispira raffinosivorans]
MWKKIFGTVKKETSTDLYDQIDQKRLPAHIAIIMDGNGRWAQNKGLMRTFGHKAGVDTLKKILKAAIKLNVKVLTVYAFSTENWKRPHKEVDFLMALFAEYLEREINEMDEDNVKIQFLGRLDELPTTLYDQIENAQTRTKSNTGVQFNVAVNYGSRDEITRSVKIIAQKVLDQKLPITEITEEIIDDNLYTGGQVPVDLVIRTSGDLRMSNFLLWQAAYAEFWFTKVNWPDFTPDCFFQAVLDFQNRDRRFGGLSEK